MEHHLAALVNENCRKYVNAFFVATSADSWTTCTVADDAQLAGSDHPLPPAAKPRRRRFAGCGSSLCPQALAGLLRRRKLLDANDASLAQRLVGRLRKNERSLTVLDRRRRSVTCLDCVH